jgi:hypothetical protein
MESESAVTLQSWHSAGLHRCKHPEQAGAPPATAAVSGRWALTQRAGASPAPTCGAGMQGQLLRVPKVAGPEY